jgi:hypothetical protein
MEIGRVRGSPSFCFHLYRKSLDKCCPWRGLVGVERWTLNSRRLDLVQNSNLLRMWWSHAWHVWFKFFYSTKSATDSTNCQSTVHQYLHQLSITVKHTLWCGFLRRREMGFYWRRRRRGGMRSVPDDQPQYINYCEVCLVCLPSMKACNLLTVFRTCLTDVWNQSLLGKLLSTT